MTVSSASPPNTVARSRREASALGRWLVAAAPAAVALAILAAGPLVSSYTRFIVSLAAIGAMVAVGLVPLMGQVRIVSLASAAFVGIGAYATGVTMERFALPYLAAGLVAVAIGVVLGVLLGVPAARFRGHYLTLVTLVFQIVVVVGLREWHGVTGGPRGFRFPPIGGLFGLGTETTVFVLALLALAVFLVLFELLASGDFGKALIAVANAEVAAESFAVRPERYRLLAFAFSSLTAAAGGVFLAPLLRVFDPTAFDMFVSVRHIAFVVIGGLGSVWGAALGAGLLTFLPEFLRPLAEYQEVIFAAVLLGAVLLVPDGIAGRITALVRKTRRLGGGAAAGQADDPEPPIQRPPATVTAVPRRDDEVPGEPARDVLRCRGVTRSFSGLRAVQRVDLEIPGKHIRGLIGPNGAGKTTLVNLISGLERCDEGQIELNGQDVTYLRPAVHAELGMSRTFQNVQLVPQLSAPDNVRLGTLTFGPLRAVVRSLRLLRDDPEVNERVEAILAAVGLEGVAQDPAGTLSLGAQRRVEIARALVSQPTLVLLDEPAAGLTRPERVELAGVLRAQVESRDVSMLVIDHDIEFVRGIADAITALVQGEVVMEGRPDEVLADAGLRRAYFGA